MVSISGTLGEVSLFKGAGGAPKYATKWLGPWTVASSDGTCAEIDGHVKACKDVGVAPFFQLFYFGDEICLEALKGTVQPKDYSGKVQSLGGYWALVKLVGARCKAAGVQALVAPEPEWNKRGPNAPSGTQSVLDDPAVWDTLFRDTAWTLQGYGCRVITVPGSWADLSPLLQKFPKMMQVTDYVGTQMLRCVVRPTGASYADRASSYDSGPDSVLGKVQGLRAVTQKPVIVTDVAFSSYGANTNPNHPFDGGNGKAEEARQGRAFEHLRALLPKFQEAGVTGLILRSTKDSPNFDVKNYYGYGERCWGVVRADGSQKASYSAYVALAQAGGTSPPPLSEPQLTAPAASEDPCASINAENTGLRQRVSDLEAQLGARTTERDQAQQQLADATAQCEALRRKVDAAKVALA